MKLDAAPFAILLVAVLLLGLRDTWALRREYSAIAPALQPRFRAIGRAFVVASVMVVVAVGWFGLLAVRRMLGLEQFTWSAPVSFALAIPVLLLPTYFRHVWDEIGRDPSAAGGKFVRRGRKR